MSIRILLTAGVLWAGVALLNALCWRPYQCNKIERIAKARSEVTANMGGGRDAVLGRKTLQLIDSCMECRPSVDLYMIAAFNYRVLGQYDRAIQMYEAALRLDRRPELYVNLGAAKFEAGRAGDAERDFMTAATFYPDSTFSMPSPYDTLIRARVMEHDRQMRATIGRR